MYVLGLRSGGILSNVALVAVMAYRSYTIQHTIRGTVWRLYVPAQRSY